jgi:hypothetical protein
MIKHMVMWIIREGDTPREKTDRMMEVKSRLMGLKGKIPEIVNMEVHFGLPLAPKDNYDVILISDFKSWSDLQTYQSHPAHLEVGAYVKNVKQSRSCIDFEY